MILVSVQTSSRTLQQSGTCLLESLLLSWWLLVLAGCRLPGQKAQHTALTLPPACRSQQGWVISLSPIYNDRNPSVKSGFNQNSVSAFLPHETHKSRTCSHFRHYCNFNAVNHFSGLGQKQTLTEISPVLFFYLQEKEHLLASLLLLLQATTFICRPFKQTVVQLNLLSYAQEEEKFN